jgi:enoyl-CoA hydratase
MAMTGGRSGEYGQADGAEHARLTEADGILTVTIDRQEERNAISPTARLSGISTG